MLNKRFTFLCSEEERDKLTRLAQSLHRSRGNTIRLLIREAATVRELPYIGSSHLYENQSITAEVKNADHPK
jgi:hypothetical protein